MGLDGGVGHADDADHERLAPGSAGFGGDLERKRAGAAEDGKRRLGRWPVARRVHASSSFPSRGTQIARSPPARRKATICCTAS